MSINHLNSMLLDGSTSFFSIRQPCKPSNYQAHPALRGARIAGNQHREAPKDAEDPPVKICVPSVLKEVFGVSTG